MKTQKLRENGECTECGQPATHSHECAACHVATLGVTIIQSKCSPAKLAEFAEAFRKADLFRMMRDKEENPGLRHAAYVVVNLALGRGLFVNDVQRDIARRLEQTCERMKNQTEEQREDYMRRIIDWLTTLLTTTGKAKA